MQPTERQLKYEIAAALGVAVLIYSAFRFLGFLGVGLLGVLIAFIAVQADLNKDDTSHVWAMRAAPTHEMDHAEKAAMHAENNALAHPILMGKLLGAALAIIGFGLLFFL
ncbi:hypothetical protein ASD45_05025 [Pseudolabrys sp. Root1462]|uniref:hypothetical protein n=1 Tax=Pseudolabrys sp. Root1462 TaxID=1736466 RepID=UPI0007032C33|nr:hypothetical protein [Pseudolabrys sp. Root1462]KQZ00292.1 hypothetical protein ASD45_05025 [Pseudolabrys sp. Root1462]